jgi:dihydrofolate reductase
MSTEPRLTLIAAMSEDRTLGAEGKIPWHLPDEVAHFRATCHQQCLILGRRTWDQMQGWMQPGHRPIVMTRQPTPIASWATAHSVDELGATLRERAIDEAFVIGGGEVYAALIPYATSLILTTVHAMFQGDVRFPAWDEAEWKLVKTVRHPADARHRLPFTIQWWERTSTAPTLRST